MFDLEHYQQNILTPALDELGRAFPGAARAEAHILMTGTCWQESLGGTYLHQIGGGPGLGIYQIEPDTHLDIWVNYIRFQPPHRQHFMRSVCNSDLPNNLADLNIGHLDHDQCVYDLRYATMIARLKYYRRNFEWPRHLNDLHGFGKLWDDIYNANDNHGTVQEFVSVFPMDAIDL